MTIEQRSLDWHLRRLQVKIVEARYRESKTAEAKEGKRRFLITNQCSVLRIEIHITPHTQQTYTHTHTNQHMLVSLISLIDL